MPQQQGTFWCSLVDGQLRTVRGLGQVWRPQQPVVAEGAVGPPSVPSCLSLGHVVAPGTWLSLVWSRPGPQSSPRWPSGDGGWQVGFSGPSPPQGMSALSLKLWQGVRAKKAPYPGPVTCPPCRAPGEEFSSDLAMPRLCLAARCFSSPDLGSSLSPHRLPSSHLVISQQGPGPLEVSLHVPPGGLMWN